MKARNSEFSFDIDLGDFEEKVIKESYERPVLVDFWAEWCSPCLFIAPVLNDVMNDYQGKVLLAKLEVDEGENMKLAGKYQIRGFPTIIVFQNGEQQARFSSARSKAFIEEFIEENCLF